MKNKNKPAIETIRNLYIEQLKRTLSFSLWEEPAWLVGRVAPSRRWYRRLPSLFDRLLNATGYALAVIPSASFADRNEGRFWPSYSHTMVGNHRLDNIRDCVQTVVDEHIPGDLIETGVWRGGSCIFMRGILKANGATDRKIYVADSFAGLPPPEAHKYPEDASDRHYRCSQLAISQEEVEDNFRKYDLLDDQVVFVKGFFEDTLHKLECKQFAVIRLDGDMYSSTIQALDALYPKLAKGGYCIIDDYALHNCKAAVDDYRRDNGISEEIHRIDWTGIYWRKT